jgi:hypothetical protein
MALYITMARIDLCLLSTVRGQGTPPLTIVPSYAIASDYLDLHYSVWGSYWIKSNVHVEPQTHGGFAVTSSL